MNLSSHVFAMLLSGSMLTAFVYAEDPSKAHIPAAYPIERYTGLWEKSPFSPASVVVEAANNAEWLMTGIMIYSQTPYVTLTNRNTMKTISLSPGQKHENVKLEHAEWADDYQSSFAVVTLNGSQKRLTFDEKSLSGLSARVAPPAKAAIPAANNTSRVVIPKPSTPRVNPSTTSGTSSSQRVTPRRRIIRPSS